MKNYLMPKETERLLIRPLTKTDKGTWITFFQNPESLKYFPNFLTDNVKHNVNNWVDKQLDRYNNGRFGLQTLIEKSTGNFIGQCGLLTQEVDRVTEIEIGYSLLPQFEGKGYASEAAQFFKKYAFQNNVTDSIISIIHVDNIASQQVAIRNGMTNSKRTTFHGIDVFIFRVDK